VTGRADRTLRKAYGIAGIAGIAFFVMSVALLGVWPARVLEEQTRAMGPERPLYLTGAELGGRAVYAREGCAYCHTQQVRYVDADVARFGAPTLAWETQFDAPHLWGTRRIGPDLARAGGTRSADWQLLHLFAPRLVVPLSVMPAYPWLFDGAPDRPRQGATDLVAYLETLGRTRELAYPEGDARARASAQDDHWARMAFDAPQLNAHPARTRPRGESPALADAGPGERGQELWIDHCAACHGDDGAGDGPAARWLRPAPTNLTAREYSLARVADVLWNGVAGTSMPAWRDHPPEELAALAAHVRGLWQSGESESPAADEAAGRRVYDANCAQCHGPDGRGDGFAATELPMAPTDFTRQRASYEETLRVIRNGVDGSSMAPWTDRLTDEQIRAVAHTVRAFFGPTGGSR
jgi:cbb3-type cytochrome oxidase cytochrome c subunit/cytochrome c5